MEITEELPIVACRFSDDRDRIRDKLIGSPTRWRDHLRDVEVLNRDEVGAIDKGFTEETRFGEVNDPGESIPYHV